MQKVTFLNRAAAEQKVVTVSSAIISITQPNTSPANLQSGWYRVLPIQFDDTNPEVIQRKERKIPRIAMTLANAMTIVKFVHQTAPNIEEMIVHCQGGISRSAAVAKWIAEAYDLPFDHDYDLFNPYVYQLLKEANKRVKR